MIDEETRRVCHGVIAMAGSISQMSETLHRIGRAAKALTDAGSSTGQMGDDVRVPGSVWLEFVAATSGLPEVLKPEDYAAQPAKE